MSKLNFNRFINEVRLLNKLKNFSGCHGPDCSDNCHGDNCGKYI